MDRPNENENTKKFGERLGVQTGNLLHLLKENKNIAAIFVVFIVILLLSFGVLTMSKKEPEAVPAAEVASEPGAEEESVVMVEALEQDAYPEVNNLVKQYFQALVDGDMDAIHKIKSFTDEEEELKIVKKSEFIEAYPSLTVYTKKGPEENSYIAYVQYEVKFNNYEQTAPGLNTLYICMDENGSYYINSDELDESVVEYLKTVSVQNDVLELFNTVQVAYNDVKTKDAELSGFLDELPGLLAESVSEAIAEQVAMEEALEEKTEETPEEIVVVTKVKTTDVVNVRTSDSTEADRIGSTSVGQVLELIEEKVNGWSKVKFEGKEGFIKSDYLVPEETETVAVETEDPEAPKESEDTEETEEVKTTKGKLTDTVNIRKTDSTDGEKMGQMAKGASVDVIEKQSNGWTKIRYNDDVAYVKSDYVE